MTKNKVKGFAEQLLFVTNILIVFLLLFEGSISLPTWLQSVGRMHPMFLHFPIVILLLAMILEFFRFKTVYADQAFYKDFTTNLILIGALFASITVLMGLFLAKEGEYSGNVLQWHKWLGSGIALATSLIYWYRNFSWYKAPVSKAGALIITICLLFVGHLGATLTHGENFIMAPLQDPNSAKVPIEQAIVFNDVIRPILAAKCMGCHNSEKAKGSLLMDSPENLLKGGKTGKLFVAGEPGISLIMERIHLPLEDKKHMPVSSKPQLTGEETALLHLWIKGGADFTKKVIELPPNDSLRVIAATFLKPPEEEKFDFAAADVETVKKLNNNYRVINEIARESPALSVTIYNKNVYSPKALEELLAVKKQIVSLILNKMPVKDNELKIIGQFENLRKLNLNFTDINGDGLKYLANLKFLRNLSLSGTAVNNKTIQNIKPIKSLELLVVWSTAIKENEIRELQKSNKKIKFILGYKDDGLHPIKLNAPVLEEEMLPIFTNMVSIKLTHPIRGVQIRYTTDGTEPDSIHGEIYKNDLTFTTNTVLRAKVYKPGWYGSDAAQFSFLKSAYQPDSIRFQTLPDEKYKGGGPKTLVDHQLGTTDFGSGKWIGSRKNLEIIMQFTQPVALHAVTLNMMRNIGSSIFFPAEIEVWTGSNPGKLTMQRKIKPAAAIKDEPPLLSGMECTFDAVQTVTYLKIIVKPVQKIPEWHASKGEPGWLFVDEILLR